MSTAHVPDGTAASAAPRALPTLGTSPAARGELPPGPLRDALEEATRCIQCGFCLPACPTYKVFGQEKHSPRGRIQLVKSWAEGAAEPDAGLIEALDVCLDCRACEVACPIDVRYGVVLAGARDELAERAAASPESSSLSERLQGAMLWTAMRRIVVKPKRMRFLTRLGHRVLNSAPGRAVRRRLGKRPDSWLGAAMTFADALPMPDAKPVRLDAKPTKSARSHATRTVSGEAARQAEPRRAMMLLGCAQEAMFPETNRSTASLLEQAGYAVETPAGQGCCGALHRHYGDKDYARELVIQNLHAFGAFDEHNDTPIIMNAGGCMAWVKEAAELFEPGTPEHAAAQRMADRTRDISEVFVEDAAEVATAGDEATEPPPLRVMYQPSCHLSNVCGVSEEPLELLQRITGGNACLPPDGGSCCGSAGIYNALHPQESRAILDKKMDGIADNPPDVIVTSNPGCHLQMRAGVRAFGLEHKVRVMQLADFVREYGKQVGHEASTAQSDHSEAETGT